MKDQSQKRIIFLKGHKVILRPLRKETDLESCLRWVNNPGVNRYLNLFLPVSETAEEKWFDNLEKEKDSIILAIETFEGEFIGLMGLHKINWRDRTAITGALIGEEKYRNKGYGTDAKMILLNYAFNTLNLRKICSSVLSFNKRSLHYNLHCGYKIEGRRRKQIFREDRYWDEIILGLFKNNWLPIWRRYQKKALD